MKTPSEIRDVAMRLAESVTSDWVELILARCHLIELLTVAEAVRDRQNSEAIAKKLKGTPDYKNAAMQFGKAMQREDAALAALDAKMGGS